ncbi:MAG: ABC transporter permease [Rhodovulum sulfidophilum]|uniref:ABC transporter permease n=1 Tax=Rhodovulum sulfidophilum TaxID=35806 RepID=A0A2W5QA64_RHOSU|nr:MAG: ABC transporter permease [Rhodovulum sulfidophilum]
MAEAGVSIERSDAATRVVFSGRLVIATLSAAQRALADLAAKNAVKLDLGGVEKLDTSGAWLVIDLARRLEAEGLSVAVENASPVQASLIETVRKSVPEEEAAAKPRTGFVQWLEQVGEYAAETGAGALALLDFLGRTLARFAVLALTPWRIRWTSTVFHMREVGLNAVPIVSLMSFLIGVVLAFQGAAQLKQFGAGIFIVDLIAISVLRELGILLTAIIVAGRSGSAFTAAIGSMKMREEIDAMRTLGLDPIEVLVVPRVLALLLMLPILGFIANCMGLLGGLVMAWIELDVSPLMYITRLQNSVGVWHYLVGIIKAPFFAVIIAIVGCFKGMCVEGNAESLGRMTSQSVVAAIFLVIAADALFSVFFALVGV